MSSNPENLGSKSRISRATVRGLEEDLNSFSRNALNSSSSKMQYSFPKSDRFSERQNSIAPPFFYEVPDTKSKRATSFGYGNKTQLGKQTVKTPGPNNYYLKREFDSKDKVGITMSAGRQVIKVNSPFSTHAVKNPSPSDYQPSRFKMSHSFSIREKIEDRTDRWIRSVPGPGNYDHIQLLDKTKRSPISNYESCAITKFGKVQRKGLGPTHSLKVPGVGEYELKKEDTHTSKFYIRAGSLFGRSQRKSINDSNMVTPGPGTYQRFSDFLH